MAIRIDDFVSDSDAEKSLEEFRVRVWMNFNDLEKLQFYLERILENYRPMEFAFAEFLVDTVRNIRKGKKEIKNEWTAKRKDQKAKKK